MKAAVLYGKEDVRVEDLAPKALQPGEVRIQIEAALTCGTDLKVFKRGYHARMIVPPAVFGHELAGTIAETRHKNWKLGDRVVVANSAPCGVCPACRRGQENLCRDLQFLNGGQTLNQTYTVTINDGHGGTVSQGITITLVGADDADPNDFDDQATGSTVVTVGTVVHGTPGNDSIAGGGNTGNIIYGGAGNDTLIGGSMPDHIEGSGNVAYSYGTAFWTSGRSPDATSTVCCAGTRRPSRT